MVHYIDLDLLLLSFEKLNPLICLLLFFSRHFKISKAYLIIRISFPSVFHNIT